MADIHEKVIVDTSSAVADLGELEQASHSADTALDQLAEQAQAVDREEVTIPVDVPGAGQAATELGNVDQQARAMAQGAQVGTQHVSDLAGMFGNAGGQASQFGQAIEGAGGIVESFAGQLGLSESAAGKLTSAIGLVAVGVAAAAAAWAVYKQDAADAKKGLDETRDALGQVYDKLKEGDTLAASKTFVDTMGDKIDGFRRLVGDQVSKADIAGVIFGDPNSIARVDAAIDHLDGTSKVLAEGGLGRLKVAWADAKKATDDNTALESTVQSYFGNVAGAAGNATQALDTYTSAAGRATAATPGQFGTGVISSRTSAADVAEWAAQVRAAAGAPTVVNHYPPANTPLAVEQAQTRWNSTQGYS